MGRRRRTEEENDEQDLNLYEVRAVTVRVASQVLRRGHLLTRREIGRDLDLFLAAGVVVRTNLRVEQTAEEPAAPTEETQELLLAQA